MGYALFEAQCGLKLMLVTSMWTPWAGSPPRNALAATSKPAASLHGRP